MSGTRSSPIYILDDDDDDAQTIRNTPSPHPVPAVTARPNKKRKRQPSIIYIDADEPVAGPSQVQPTKKKNKKSKLRHKEKEQQQAQATADRSRSPSLQVQQIDEQSVSHSNWLNSSSDWVNSMAQATETNNVWDFLGLQPAFPPFSYVPPVPFLPVVPHGDKQTHVLKWPNIIGMPPERDTAGRRSSFIPSSSTKFELISGASFPYTPDPARTLVMDQLPKSHRDPSFFKSWCRKVCSASPVFLAVDVPSAKALISFATPELAKRAWCSPKLAPLPEGTAPKQLKGKPRLDLVRVWWLRQQESPLSFNSPPLEPEEGEIVDDDEIMQAVEDKAETSSSSAAVPNTVVASLPPKPPAECCMTNDHLPSRSIAATEDDSERTSSSTSAAQPDIDPDQLATEERLRRLVLASKRKQKESALPASASNPSMQAVSGVAPERPSQPVAATVPSSLDDLATSFITEAIQTVKPVAGTRSARLAALDQEIAERNLLFDKLAKATTRQEREHLLTQLRQRDREVAPSVASRNMKQPDMVSQLRWPVIPSTQECILILSDDEDEDG